MSVVSPSACLCECVCGGGCSGSLFCGLVLNVLSSLAIIMLRERERKRERERERERKKESFSRAVTMCSVYISSLCRGLSTVCEPVLNKS